MHFHHNKISQVLNGLDLLLQIIGCHIGKAGFILPRIQVRLVIVILAGPVAGCEKGNGLSFYGFESRKVGLITVHPGTGMKNPCFIQNILGLDHGRFHVI